MKHNVMNSLKVVDVAKFGKLGLFNQSPALDTLGTEGRRQGWGDRFGYDTPSPIYDIHIYQEMCSF